MTEVTFGIATHFLFLIHKKRCNSVKILDEGMLFWLVVLIGLCGRESEADRGQWVCNIAVGHAGRGGPSEIRARYYEVLRNGV